MPRPASKSQAAARFSWISRGVLEFFLLGGNDHSGGIPGNANRSAAAVPAVHVACQCRNRVGEESTWSNAEGTAPGQHALWNAQGTTPDLHALWNAEGTAPDRHHCPLELRGHRS